MIGLIVNGSFTLDLNGDGVSDADDVAMADYNGEGTVDTDDLDVLIDGKTSVPWACLMAARASQARTCHAACPSCVARPRPIVYRDGIAEHLDLFLELSRADLRGA